MKIKVKNVSETEVEIALPVYRKRYSDNYAKITEKGHYIAIPSINCITKYTSDGSEYFDANSQPCTEQEFMDAINQVKANITKITEEL